jgi:solute carrier family 25 carnitine/acylcarnitine transporter 20/29
MTVHHIAKSAIHVMCFVLWASAIFCSSTHPIEAFTPAPRLTTRQQSIYILNQRHEQTRLSLINTGVASLLAGSVGGAIGVGVAYPFDTIKTKAQVYSQSQRQQYPPQKILQQQHLSNSTTIATSVLERHPGTVHPPHSNQYLPIESPEDDLISLIRLILQLEGISGFFGGVRAMMIGQAIIKSVAFGANEFMLGILNSNAVDGGDEVSFATLLIAASFSGFVTSFLVAPVGEYWC